MMTQSMAVSVMRGILLPAAGEREIFGRIAGRDSPILRRGGSSLAIPLSVKQFHHAAPHKDPAWLEGSNSRLVGAVLTAAVTFGYIDHHFLRKAVHVLNWEDS